MAGNIKREKIERGRGERPIQSFNFSWTERRRMNESINSAAAEQTEKNEVIDKRAEQIVAEAIARLELNSRMIAVASENFRKRILFACIVYLGAIAGAEAVSVPLAPTWGSYSTSLSYSPWCTAVR